MSSGDTEHLSPVDCPRGPGRRSQEAGLIRTGGVLIVPHDLDSEAVVGTGERSTTVTSSTARYSTGCRWPSDRFRGSYRPANRSRDESPRGSRLNGSEYRGTGLHSRPRHPVRLGARIGLTRIFDRLRRIRFRANARRNSVRWWSITSGPWGPGRPGAPRTKESRRGRRCRPRRGGPRRRRPSIRPD